MQNICAREKGKRHFFANYFSNVSESDTSIISSMLQLRAFANLYTVSTDALLIFLSPNSYFVIRERLTPLRITSPF